MCSKLARDFDTAHYLNNANGDKPTVRNDLASERRPVTVCIPSLPRLGSRPPHIKEQFYDEFTSSLRCLRTGRGSLLSEREAIAILD